MNQRLFCFGYGYSASVLASRLIRKGWRVAGTTRRPEKRAAMVAEGIDSYLLDDDTPIEGVSEALAGTTHLLASVPPDDGGDPVLRRYAGEIVATAPQWVGYLSTTGVYGDRAGGWVDEESDLLPTGPRGARRLSAEHAWLGAWEQHDLPVHLFRLAGIYGPGRNALETLLAGRARRVDKPGQVFSRIHVADIATVLEASFARPQPGRAYNLCDDDPAPPQEVIAHASRLLGREPPPLIPFEEAELSEMARSFYQDNKRVSNRRIKEELGVELAYPDYRSGLDALLADLRAAET